MRRETSGQAALQAIDETVDAVLLDRQMPGLSGDEVLRRLRASGNECPVALVTTSTPNEALIELPLDDCVAKPIDRAELLAVVERLFAISEYDADARRCLRLSVKLGLLASRCAVGLPNSRYLRLVRAFKDAATRISVPVTDLPLHTACPESVLPTSGVNPEAQL